MNSYIFFQYQDIIKSIQNPMKCAIIECEREASRPFKACSADHGSYLNVILGNLETAVTANDQNGRDLFTIEKAEHYGQFVR